MMAQRLEQMKRLLKPTGSIYLHCDPTASHYLKMLMDVVFGKENFRNEIVWKRYAVHSLAQYGFDAVSDNILFYSASHVEGKFNSIHGFSDDYELEKRFPHIEDNTGRRFQHVALEQSSNKSSAGETRTIQGREVVSELGWRWSQKTFDRRLDDNPEIIYWTRNGRPRYKKYADEYKGSPSGNIWTDIPYLSSGDRERTGYPKKPLALLERVIKASSNPGDVVLDPFCGCATTCVNAERWGRQWIGIDIGEKALWLVESRLQASIDKLALYHPGDVIHHTDQPHRTDIGPLPDYRVHKDSLYGHQGGNCGGCGEHFLKRNITVDHIHPKKQGGTDHIENLWLLCGACNSSKGTKSQVEFLRERMSRKADIAP